MTAWCVRSTADIGIGAAQHVDVSCRLNANRLGSDCAESRKLDREGSPARRVGVAVEDRFYPQNGFTAANTTTIGAGIGDRAAVFAINRLMEQNTADRWFCTNFYDFCHRASPLGGVVACFFMGFGFERRPQTTNASSSFVSRRIGK